MSLTAGLGQMPTSPNLALMNSAAMLGMAEVAAATDAHTALRAQRQAAANAARARAAYAAPSGSGLDRLLGQDIPFEAIRAEIAQGIDQGIHAAIAANAEAQVLEEFKDSLAALLSDIDDQGGLEEWLDGLASQEGGKEARRLLRNSERLTKGLNAIATRIDGLRRRTDEQIAASVEDVNDILLRLADASQRIAVDSACGQDPSYLFEERDEHLALLFALLDVVSFIRGDGSAAVYMRGGSPLLDGPTAKRIGFRLGESITLDGRDIGAELGSGRLFGLLSLRDKHLLGLAAQLDSLSQLIRDQVNRLFNRAISKPAQALGLYAGSREFLNPDRERLFVSGGDCVLTLFDEANKVLSATSVSQLAARSLLAEGRPAATSWTVRGFVLALDNWLRESLRTEALLAFLDDAGRICVALPRGRLSWRDQRCTALDSHPVADATKPLGMSGTLALRDIFGNLFSVQILASDSLRDLAERLTTIGLAGAIVGQRDGQILRINNPSGCDLYLEPDPPGRPGPASLLKPIPAAPLPAVDLAVDWDIDHQGIHLESAPFAQHNRALGIDGVLGVISQDGRRTELAIDPAMTLAGLVGQFNAAGSCNGLTAMMKEAGNRWIIRIGGGPGQNLSAEGAVAAALGLRPPPDVTSQGLASFFGLNDFFAPPGRKEQAESKGLAAGFSTFNATGLTLIQRHGRRQSIVLPPGQGLEAILQAILAQSDMVAGQIRDEEGMARLLLTSLDGGALQVTGSLAALLSFSDGLRPSSTELETRPDLLPEMLPPTAAALMAEALNAVQPIPNGGVLPSGNSSLREAGRGIVGRHYRLLAEGQAMVIYQQTLTDGLRRHRRKLNHLDMDTDAVQLNSFRDAYLENASVLAGLSRLAAQLTAPAAALH